ncbi:MAG: ribosomal protein S18-alanine N-acetyltransferase [Firmicutes bacterium]|nr:ribosomal protein S18-alanine N-acetyltransferase [Bacillota bacterium]
MTIRQADARDADAIYEIETLCFPDPWSRQSLREELESNPRAFYVVAEIAGEIVGYAGLWWILDEGHITNVAVKPGYRNRRIGSQIIETMLEHTTEQGIRHYTLEVRESNISARALYEKYGFQVEGIRKEYYQVGREDALIMWKHEE